MDEKRKNYFDFKVLIGVLVLLAGGVLLADNLGARININVLDFWPLLLIIFGIDRLAKPGHHGSVTVGIVAAGLGVLFLLNNLDVIHFRMRDLWPVVLILVGVVILKNAIFKPKKSDEGGCCGHFHDGREHMFCDDRRTLNDDQLDVSVTMGSGVYNIASKQFKGGRVTSLLSGVELDFRDAEIAGKEAVLHVEATLAGIEMRVPRHWEVVFQGRPTLGAMENKTSGGTELTRKLIVSGSATLGAVEVKN